MKRKKKDQKPVGLNKIHSKPKITQLVTGLI